MTNPTPGGVSRRDLLKTTGSLGAASVLAGVTLPHVHAAPDNQIRVALVGCGGRGTGAAENALRNKVVPAKLVAMADVFPEKLNSSYRNLNGQFKDQVDVPEDRRFVGFDGYQRAIDTLRPGDVVIFATPPAFRWVQFGYAIHKGVNVFMEKPTTVDGPSSKKMFKLAEDAEKKNLKVGVGLMCRHCEARGELFKRLKDGAIGDITLLRAYRMAGVTAMEFSPPKPAGISDLMYQIKRFHSFLWASGGSFSDFLIHNIDEACWMKDAWPVKAQGVGGRHYRGNNIDQNFDSYAVEYTYADGTKFLLEGRSVNGSHQEFATYAHGSKGAAIVSTAGHIPARSRIFKGHNFTRDNQIWQCQKDEPNPYQLEWEHLMEAIVLNKPYNEAKRGCEASLVTAMGRMACHTGQIITYDQMLNHEHELAPTVDKMTFDAAAPVLPNKDGIYPVPQPGKLKNREYEMNVKS